MTIHIFNISILLILFIFASFVLSKNKKSIINILFTLFIYLSILWMLSNYLADISNNYKYALLWSKIAIIGPAFLPSIFLHFSLIFPRKREIKFKHYLLLYLPSVIIVCLSPFRFNIENVIIRDWGVEITAGKLYYFLFIYFIIYFFASVYNLILSYKKSNGLIKAQIRYILLGFGLAFIFGIVTNLILVLLGIARYTSYAPLSAFPFIVFTSYAITRYRLMDIKLIIKRSTVFTILVVFITAIYALISFIISQYFSQLFGEHSLLISGIITGIFVAIGFDPIKNWLERITDRFLFSKEYNPNILLSEISNISTSTLDLHQILKNFSRKLINAFHAEKIGIILINKKNQMSFSYNFGFDKKEIGAFLTKKSKFLLKYFSSPNDIYVIPELKLKYEKGEYKPKDVSILEFMDKIAANLIMPLYSKDKIVGIMALGNKKSGDPYSAQDLQVLSIIVRQISIALENASLYDQVIDLNVNLQNKVNEQTAEITDKNVKLEKLLEMKDDFMHIASHQLRTPLTALVGLLEMQETGDFERLKASKAKEMKHNIFLSAMRLRNIVNDLLKAAEAETGLQVEFEPVDVKSLVDEAIDTLKPEYDKNGLFIKFQTQGKIPKITGSPRYLREVFMNLIHNAQRYTKQGGANLLLEKIGNSVVFTITDTGIGVTKEEMKTLFTKFTRGRRAIQFRPDGSGLGLFIIKNIVEAHKGKIELSSEGENKGTTVKVILPIKQVNHATELV